MADTIEQILAEQPRRLAVAKLVGQMEGLISSGLLGEQLELTCRLVTNEVCRTHGMATIAERDTTEVA